jgi:hypothetical protein
MTLIPELQRDLVDAAARMTIRRKRFGLPLRVSLAVAAATALVVAGLVIVGRDTSDPRRSTGEPAGTPTNPTSPTVPERAPQAPPRGGPRPIPGSFSRPVRFEFGEIPYSLVGFRGSRRPRERGETICTRLVEGPEGPGRPLASYGCAGERLLRREFDDHPVRTFGGSGGEYAFVSGFARADVANIAVVAPQYPSRVVLSEPWSPEPRRKPIRFFLVVIDPPPDAGPEFPLRTRIRLQGRLTSGETVEGVP